MKLVKVFWTSVLAFIGCICVIWVVVTAQQQKNLIILGNQKEEILWLENKVMIKENWNKRLIMERDSLIRNCK